MSKGGQSPESHWRDQNRGDGVLFLFPELSFGYYGRWDGGRFKMKSGREALSDASQAFAHSPALSLRAMVTLSPVTAPPAIPRGKPDFPMSQKVCRAPLLLLGGDPQETAAPSPTTTKMHENGPPGSTSVGTPILRGQ